MENKLLNVVKQIVADYGEGILSEQRPGGGEIGYRVKSLFADLAKNEPKPQKNAFLKCLEHGFAQILKNASEPDRAACKQSLAQKLHNEEGLDMNLCAQSIGLLAAVLFGEEFSPPAVPEQTGKNGKPETCYYLSYNFKETGPFTISEINKMIANRQITKDYYIRPENSSKWEPVTKLFTLSSSISSGSGSSGYGVNLIPPSNTNNNVNKNISKPGVVKNDVFPPKEDPNDEGDGGYVFPSPWGRYGGEDGEEGEEEEEDEEGEDVQSGWGGDEDDEDDDEDFYDEDDEDEDFYDEDDDEDDWESDDFDED